jgi:hypothetical protein
MTATLTYRCSTCSTLSTHPADDDIPVCNGSDDCGLLYPTEIVPAPRRRYRFDLIGSGYVTGDERAYDVLDRGRLIGIVERTWLPSPVEDGIPTEGWVYNGVGTPTPCGTGRTRNDAVNNGLRGDS